MGTPAAAFLKLTGDEIAHLEMIQGIISRMAANSFKIKAWGVGVVTGALALTTGERLLGTVLAAAIAVTFWFLDSFYLRQERLYRRLFDEVRLQKGVSPFDMNTKSTRTSKVEYCAQCSRERS